jgi:hypothetical protein
MTHSSNNNSTVNFGCLVTKDLEFSSNQQTFKIKYIVFIKLFKNKFVMFICSPATWQFSQPTLAALLVMLPHANAMTLELAEFVITLQYRNASFNVIDKFS